ncbi:hypothetical protein LIER_40575 [Lithospermum erythrorhizon]|uniref:Reverse transcriptase Ty1/copia-type domain-containing protein n=1 Tax=Lithospermum erythrorhizon TaxID=34254 RepID=A0AAV3QXT3_LITER
MSFLANLAKVQEPHSFKKARLSEDWMEAMALELQALEQNNTWDIVDLPSGVKPIGCKWVYKVKCKPYGIVDKKARLVAKGYNQIEGIEYCDSLAKLVTMRLVLALVASKT